jgi:cytochrome c oxidase subunit II
MKRNASPLKRALGLFAGLGAFATTAIAFAAPKGETGWTLPHDASAYGTEIDWLINITCVFMTILFIIMCVWMGIAVIKHGKTHSADYDHGDSAHSVKTAALLSAVIFFVVDGNLWWKSTKDVNGTFWNFGKVEMAADAVRIEVNARQWIWEARYPGPDGQFNTEDDALVTNDIRVPIDTPVYFELGSPDVIHSFYLPNFRIKQDAVPGMINKLWLQAKETGEFDIACAQHCGANHYQMKGMLTVLPKEEYKAWAALRSEDSKRIFDEADIEAHWGWAWKKD